jgi:hypothetical protein
VVDALDAASAHQGERAVETVADALKIANEARWNIDILRTRGEIEQRPVNVEEEADFLERE